MVVSEENFCCVVCKGIKTWICDEEKYVFEIKKRYHLIPNNTQLEFPIWGNDHNKGIIKLLRIHRSAQDATWIYSE